MNAVNRRRFMQLGAVGSAGVAAMPGQVFAAPQTATPPTASADDRLVRMTGDGLGLTPVQYSRLLARLAEEHGIASDSYSLDGVVEQLETEFARRLGKERALFMPTGTLANHMAVRALAGGPSRVILQEESHLYQDEGDCAQTLSSLTLMPLAKGRATFTADDVQQVIDQTKAGRVVSRVSVISVETPVRRRLGERFESTELQKVIALAGREGIRLHLDGARLFLQAAYTGESITETVRPFDTVYISLYKYFNAASGAILAGPRDLLDGMYHGRRMFGGGLNQAWPFAAVALHYLPGFEERFMRAVRVSEDLIRTLGRHEAFAVERITPGSNIFRLRLHAGDAAAFQKRLAGRGVMLPTPQRDTFVLGVNETWNRTSVPELSDIFIRGIV